MSTNIKINNEYICTHINDFSLGLRYFADDLFLFKDFEKTQR